MKHTSHLCRCGRRASMVADIKAYEFGQVVERRLACDHCAATLHADPVVDRKDLPAILGTDTCWCDSSRRLNVRLEVCPKHGRFPIHR